MTNRKNPEFSLRGKLPQNMPIPIEDRIQRYITIEAGCWMWTGHRDRLGYGRIGVSGQLKYAHRVVYELKIGTIPGGKELDHLCSNRACVSPEHLEPVSHRENLLRGRGWGAKNARKVACKRGHAFDKENTGLLKDGRRYCRACLRMSSRQQRAKKKAAA